MRKTLAAIDIGSNTVQLLVSTYEGRELVQRKNYLRTTRLGAMREPNVLADSSMAATAEAMAEFIGIAKAAGVSATRIVATSAVRDAKNKAEFLRQMAQVTKVPVEILSGQEEALLSYCGALACTPLLREGVPVIDSGGSSTEFIFRGKLGKIRSFSADIGAVRAKYALMNRRDIKSRLNELLPDLPRAETVVGVGGTITTIAGVLLGLDEFDRDAIEGCLLSPAALEAMLSSLIPLTLAERCCYSPLLTVRGEIIAEGLMIWLAIAEMMGIKKIVVCGGGILDGAIASML